MENLQEFNLLLVKLFNNILDYEEDVLVTSEFKDLTSNDTHVISAIGVNSKKNMSMVAQELSVTVGSLTIAVNGLVRKGYVLKERSDKDKRVVFVRLSKKGENAFLQHENLHYEMVKAMLQNLDTEEMTVLMNAMTKIDNWVRLKTAENKEIKR